MGLAIWNVKYIVPISTGTKSINNSINHIIGKSDCYSLLIAAEHAENSLSVCFHVRAVEQFIAFLRLLEFDDIFHPVNAVGNELVPFAVIGNGIIVAIID